MEIHKESTTSAELPLTRNSRVSITHQSNLARFFPLFALFASKNVKRFEMGNERIKEKNVTEKSWWEQRNTRWSAHMHEDMHVSFKSFFYQLRNDFWFRNICETRSQLSSCPYVLLYPCLMTVAFCF